jgi:hypothetical protein
MATHVKFDELVPMRSIPSVVEPTPHVDLGSTFESDPGEVEVHEDGGDETDHEHDHVWRVLLPSYQLLLLDPLVPCSKE